MVGAGLLSAVLFPPVALTVLERERRAVAAAPHAPEAAREALSAASRRPL